MNERHSKNEVIRVLIADDQQLLLTLFSRVLTAAGMEIIGECNTVEGLIEKYREKKPDVLLLDIRFGTPLNGFDAIISIKQFDPNAKIIVISQFDMPPYVTRVYELGAHAFLTKNCDEETLIHAINEAQNGRRFYMPNMAEMVVTQMSSHDNPDPKKCLNARHFEIFLHIAKGLTNQEVAKELNVHVNFVSQHRQKIQDILRIDRPQQYTMMAIKFGYMEVN